MTMYQGNAQLSKRDCITNLAVLGKKVDKVMDRWLVS